MYARGGGREQTRYRYSHPALPLTTFLPPPEKLVTCYDLFTYQRYYPPFLFFLFFLSSFFFFFSTHIPSPGGAGGGCVGVFGLKGKNIFHIKMSMTEKKKKEQRRRGTRTRTRTRRRDRYIGKGRRGLGRGGRLLFLSRLGPRKDSKYYYYYYYY